MQLDLHKHIVQLNLHNIITHEHIILEQQATRPHTGRSAQAGHQIQIQFFSLTELGVPPPP